MSSIALRYRLLPALLLLSAGCALHPTPPDELQRNGAPLPMDVSVLWDRDGTTLYGLTIEHLRRGGMTSEVGGERHLDGLSQFELWRGGELQWQVLCPMRDSRWARGRVIAACTLEPQQGQTPSAVVLSSEMHGALSGVFVSNATVAYALRATHLMDEGAYAHAFTAGVEVRRVGGQDPIAFVNSRAGTAAGGYIADEVPEAERRALAPLLLTLSCLMDPRGGMHYASGGTSGDRRLPPEYRVGGEDFVTGQAAPPELPRTPITPEHRAIVERLVQSGFPAQAEAFSEVIAESETKDLRFEAPIAGPDLRDSRDSMHVFVDLLSLGLRLPNPPHHPTGAFLSAAVGMQFLDFVDLYASLELFGYTVAAPLPEVPSGVGGEFTKSSGVALGFGLRLAALRWRAWVLSTGLEVSIRGSSHRFEGETVRGPIVVEAEYSGATMSPFLGIRYDLGRNIRGQGGALLIEGRVDRTHWQAPTVLADADRTASSARDAADEIADRWSAVGPAPSTWSGAIKVAVRFQF